MGCFSWITCDTNKPLRIGKQAHLLIPKEFNKGNKGGSFYESAYDGYGNFDGRDVYELAAEWNREFLSEDMLRDEPKLENFGGLYRFQIDKYRESGMPEEEINRRDLAQKEKYYKAALQRRQVSIARLTDYRNGLSDADMEEKYGECWKREIGIDIACYDKQNASLPYPIKITEKICLYETQPASKGDPNQGYF